MVAKRILVTGSEGSLMQAVIPQLVNVHSHTVMGVDNLSRYGRRRNIADAKYDFVKQDLLNPFETDYIIRDFNPDVIIQGAAKIYGVGGFHAHGAEILGDDISLHRNVLNSAVKNKVDRVVYISSSMVYEMFHGPVPEENVNWSNVHQTDYGLSKYTCERLSQAYKTQFGLDYLIWRPFNIITPYETAEGEIGTSHVFADFIHQIVVKKARELPIIGDGEQTRCFTDIRDVSKCIADHSTMEHKFLPVWNVGSTVAVSMRYLALRIAQLAYDKKLIDFNEVSFKTVKEYKDDVRHRRPTVTKIIRELGWTPKYTLDDAINQCLEQFENGVDR